MPCLFACTRANKQEGPPISPTGFVLGHGKPETALLQPDNKSLGDGGCKLIIGGEAEHH